MKLLSSLSSLMLNLTFWNGWQNLNPKLRPFCYSYEAAYWNAYLNRLCLNAFFTWIKEYLDFPDKLEVWPSQDEFPKLWEFVNGTAIQLGETRIVLIPTEAIDVDEICVQQEWIDIPNWVANYYVLVQVNPDSGWLRVLGFATHQMLKQKKEYNEITRTYSLEREELIEDLNAMWIERELDFEEKSEVESLPKLSPADAKRLLEQLRQPSFCSPRLDVEFEQWGALLEDRHLRQDLYNFRVAGLVAGASKTLVNLSGWLQRNCEAGWQGVEEIFGLGGANTAFAFRSGQGSKKSVFNKSNAIPPLTDFLSPNQDEETRLKTADFLVQIDAENLEAIATLIELVNTSQYEWIRLKAAENLGRINIGNIDAINALTTLLRTSQDERLCWQAALSLGRIDPSNPAAGVDRGRLIDLGMEVAGHPIALIVDIRPKPDREVCIFLRVCPTGGETYLPPDLELIVLDESGEVFDRAQARNADNWIQLEFSVEVGDRFSVKVALGDASYTEDFVS